MEIEHTKSKLAKVHVLDQTKSFWNKKEFLMALIFCLVSFLSVLYSFTLPFRIHGDTYVTLLANKAIEDPTFPDRELLLNMDFKPYLFTNTLQFLGHHFTLFEGRMILLFIIVFLTGYFGYVAFRMLQFSRPVSVLVSLVALMPRVGVSGGVFGVITSFDVVGQSFGFFLQWLLLAWFLRRKWEDKNLWPVFVFSGLVSYIHPVSFIFFNAELFLLLLYWVIIDKNYKQQLMDFLYSVLAFSITASVLLNKILFVTKGIGLSKYSGPVYSNHDYVFALMYRVGWDFFPLNLVYLIHFLVINIVFIGIAIYVTLKILKKNIEKNSYRYFLSKTSGLIIFMSVTLFIAIPNTELLLVKHFGIPFILQQTSRFFQYYYLGIFVLFAVGVEYIYSKIRLHKKFWYVFALIVGISSSTFGFELFKFVVGYHNFKQEYVPNFLQKNKLIDDRVVIPQICYAIREAGVKRDDLVISDDFQLRYWCEQKISGSFEEGSIYFMLGKNQLVNWSKEFDQEEKALFSHDPNDLILYAKSKGASYAIIENNLELVENFRKLNLVLSEKAFATLVKIK